MADIAEMLYNYNPQGYYEQNRLRSLMADSELIKQATEQAKLNRQQKIWGLQDLAAKGDADAKAQLAYYDPEGSAKTAQNFRMAMQDGGRFARAYNNAPDNMKEGLARQMIEYMGKTYGNSIISDIPPISDTANFGNFMNGLAQAVDNMDISGRDLWQEEQAMARQKYAEEAANRRMYAQEAMRERAAQLAQEQGSSSYKKMQELIQMGVPPQTAMVMSYNGNSEAVGQGLIDGSLLGTEGKKAYDKAAGKALAEEQKLQRAAQGEYDSLIQNIDRVAELLPETKISTFIDRKTPTMFFDDRTQEARGELRNILGGLRLDQMKYMKGAISDKEQEFLSDVVSGDLTKYTDNEIKGALASIKRKAKQEIKKYNNSQNTIKDWSKASNNELLEGL